MSIELMRNVLNLKNRDRLAHTEYISCHAAVRAVTGMNPDDKDNVKREACWRVFEKAWNFDMWWITNDGPVPWKERGRVTDMGHAEFAEGGTDRRDTITCPFKSEEDIWGFDAVKEYKLPDFNGLVKYYNDFYHECQDKSNISLAPGGYYKTIVSGAIDAFGWDMLLAAASDLKKFKKVLDSFFELSHHHFKAWAKTDIEFFINHDDMVWTSGAFMHPSFYREAIFPYYKKLWKTLHDAGKKVLYCSDGNFSEFIDDIADAGADGFIFEPTTDIDHIVEKYAKTKVIVGSKVDCRTLTFGNKEQIKHEIDETLKIAKKCPGFVFAVGNHIPSNVPVENALYYYDYLSKNWNR